MRRLPNLRAGSPGLMLAAVLWLLPGPARSQQRAILELSVNGVEKDEAIVWVREPDLLLRLEDLQRAGVEGFGGRRERFAGEEYVSLASLAPDVTFRVDEAALILRLTVDPRLLGMSVFELRPGRPPGIQYHEDASVFLNYALNLREFERLDGFGEAGASLSGKLLYSSFSGTTAGGFRRGLTNLTWDSREKLVRWVAGDSFATTGPLGGAIFLAGVSASREFDLDPYFIRFPGVGVSGAVTTESTAEVYVNGTLVRQLRLPPGRFDLRDVPVTAGSGTTRIVLKDAFGRRQEVASPYYVSTGTLARGLSEYSYSLGVERSNLGTESWDYGKPAFLGRHRIGWTETLTVGGRLEGRVDLASGGPIATIRVPFGELEVSTAASSDSGQTGAAGSVGYAYLGTPVSLGVRVAAMSARYATLSLAAGDDRPTLDAEGFGGLRVNSRLSLTAQFGSSEFRDRKRSDRTTLSASYRASSRMSFFASGTLARTSGGGSETEAFAGVSYFLGPFTTASVSYQRAEGAGRGFFELQRSLPPGPGIGFRVSSQGPENGAASGLVQYQNSHGRYEATYDQVEGNATTTLSASGGMVFMGGGVFFSRPLEESFALLQVPGVKGVGGYLNNQRAGETDANGNLLVPNLLPYYGNRLSIADQDVPMDRVIEATEEVVAPPPRGGALVRFPVRRIQAVRGKLFVLSAGSRKTPSYGELTVELPDGQQASPIGRDGDFYLENLPSGEVPARVVFAEGACEFLLTVPRSDAALILLGSVVCTMPDSPRSQP